MRVLTKSRFKLALECPNKLFYTRKAEYANEKIEDPFLEALAQGGFQVEELARMHYPEGILIEGDDWDYEDLWLRTQKLLEQENVIIYEAAFLIDGLFIRTDILIKRGDKIKLIEVKSKSFDPSNEYIFVGKRGGLISDWKPYLYDISFQKYVMELCYPSWKISSFIMMADKTKETSIDGLNQLFRITGKAGNRTGIVKLVNTIEEVGQSVLGIKDISEIVDGILDDKHPYYPGFIFTESIKTFKDCYQKDIYMNWPTSFSSCKSCEFKTTEIDDKNGLRSGFKECFTKQHDWGKEDFEKPKTFDVWSFTKGAKLFEDGMYFMSDLTEENIGLKSEPGRLSTTERQWLQIQKEINSDNTIFVDKEGLSEEMAKWNYPLHFIDFETSSVAMPFNKGRKPYEQIAFQFSHHIYTEDGNVIHASEYINSQVGFFPNFEFIRALRVALSNDEGTIFRYSHHENTILNAIYEQLRNSNEPDKDDLISFIQEISHSKKDSAIKWTGERDMVDLLEIVKNYYYNPFTEGSNSIKYVLPAVLNSSEFLKRKYSKTIKDNHTSSRNFTEDHIWLNRDGDVILNPYKQLPPIYKNWTEEEIEESLSEIEEIANGGAALIAYSKLQYTDMKDSEINELTKALLKYCELDTLAMVMIFEHFKNDLID